MCQRFRNKGPDKLKACFPLPENPIPVTFERQRVRDSEKSTALTRYFQTKVVVIEVKDGETQDEAWQRHLATDPATARGVIKVFHYPPPRARKTAKGHQKAPDFKKP